ncbi:MAG: cytochrome c [Gammaproteobacteria bacterium PRO9]|nr:cytochrome c [Gammaproteobacteria bacterium PRO9]
MVNRQVAMTAMCRRSWRTLMLLASVLASVTAVGAPGNGARVAEQCVSCHGAKGISSGPLWPNLKGQRVDYLVKQLEDFKRGVRRDPMMTVLVQPLTEQDMRDVAEYFSTLK